MIISPWDGGTKLYEHALDVRNGIHEVIAANVANEETPGYRAMHLPFKDALDSALSGNGPLQPSATHPGHLGQSPSGHSPFTHVTNPDLGSGMDGNTVNLEQEMTQMAENSLLYMAVAQFLAGRFESWRGAITEGRR